MSRGPRCNTPSHEHPKKERYARQWTLGTPPPARDERRAVVLAALALLMVLGVVVSLGQVPVTGPGLSDGGGVTDLPQGYMVQSAPDAALPGIARQMPNKPLEGQKREPCDKRIEKSINGACWMPLDVDPGTDACGDKAYLYNGKCYVAVSPARKPDVSLGQ
ncbi:MAG TPA: hypothetical protein VK539_03160 [Myxococcaceae bacterium]|nr:hypothetical protein [Myxococcaceae bacterium]